MKTSGLSTKFVILSSQRSGSTWLVSILDKLSYIETHGELFLNRTLRWDAGANSYPRFIEAEKPVIDLRPYSTFAYLDRLYRRTGVVGFKLMYSQLRFYPEILIYLIAKSIRVIHLVRRNHLNVVISNAVRQKIGKAHLLAGQSQPDNLQITLNPHHTIHRIKNLKRNIKVMRALLAFSRLAHIELIYEELVADNSIVNEILYFLSVPPISAPFDHDTKKIRKGSQKEVLKNYYQLKKQLQRSSLGYLIN